MHITVKSIALALALMSYPALVPAALAQAGKPAGTKSGFVRTVDGVKIHYLEAKTRLAIIEDVDGPRGSYSRKIWEGPARPAILFVPGWTMPAEIWEKQIAHLAKTHWVVAMDPRSQGQSTKTTEGNSPEGRAPDIQAVINQLQLAPVVLVGWSQGVADLVAYVDRFGTDKVAGLVLVDGLAGLDVDAQLIRELFDFIAAYNKDRTATTRQFFREMYKKPQSEAYFERITEASLRTPTTTALAMMVGIFAVDRRPALAKIDKPTLIVAAEGPYRPLQEDMKRRIPGARLEVFENAGHALFVDEPERFNSLLSEFLNRLPQGKSSK